GAMEPIEDRNGVVVGFGIRCAGCRSASFLALEPYDCPPMWRLVSGDPRKPETVTLSPSVFHTKERGGCGWHGYLRAGVWVPC
ncbi:MAG: DUF6527 family protein, partial [bacterium]